ncbi:hypothetical protein [Streptomyces canus]|uniref:hypothetical protein n=1 Tax=Streptomyces canus TaxID=58343 RepID=UPI002E2ABE3F|nr:hypothetical protein [Streptomyces canus]
MTEALVPYGWRTLTSAAVDPHLIDGAQWVACRDERIEVLSDSWRAARGGPWP